VSTPAAPDGTTADSPGPVAAASEAADRGRATRQPPGGPATASGLLPLWIVGALLVSALVARDRLAGVLSTPVVAAWQTVFMALVVQAVPFLVLGVVVSGAIAAVVPATLLARAVPSRVVLAVPVAAIAGAALPACECASVPIARRLVDRGVTPAAALAFLLASPAINPVVLVATAVAFPGRPAMVLARLAAGLLASVVVGLVWAALDGGNRAVAGGFLTRRLDQRRALQERGGGPWTTFTATAEHDLLSAGGLLVVGAAAAATLQTVVPRSVLASFAGAGWGSVVALGLLAVVLALCSEADAFVAASLRMFSPTAQLAFLTVGPMIDLKLAALQAGAFGRRFVAVFAPLTFVTAVASAAIIGLVLL